MSEKNISRKMAQLACEALGGYPDHRYLSGQCSGRLLYNRKRNEQKSDPGAGRQCR